MRFVMGQKKRKTPASRSGNGIESVPEDEPKGECVQSFSSSSKLPQVFY